MSEQLSPARRVPVEEDVDPIALVTEPGDYCGPVVLGDQDPSVYFLLPIARDDDVPPGARSIHRVASPPHVFRECPDGSLEIRESILAGHDGDAFTWHGYLDEGNVWRRV